MEKVIFHKNLSQAEEVLFDEYVEQKIPSIESLLKKFASDAPTLKLSVEKFDKHDAFQVEMILELPSKALVATETSHSVQKAIDLSKDRLVSQLKKHLAHLRKDRAHQSIRKQEAPVTENIFIP